MEVEPADGSGLAEGRRVAKLQGDRRDMTHRELSLRVVVSGRAYATRDIRQHVAVTRHGRAPAPQDLASQFAPPPLDQRRLCEEPGPVLPDHRPAVAIAADDKRIAQARAVRLTRRTAPA